MKSSIRFKGKAANEAFKALAGPPPIDGPATPIKLTAEQLHILRHSLGLGDSGKGRSYRNRYVCDPEPALQQLCTLGLMQDHGPYATFGGMHCYSVTKTGEMEAAPK